MIVLFVFGHYTAVNDWLILELKVLLSNIKQLYWSFTETKSSRKSNE